ncbi:hypothetical protein VR7878_02588 [Vibrio ruber DSM 16370]|uniref:DNA ligase n=1 Tax=Vibrio ruber (strain DSM 16370 / JCM 11486 / BCRC 17186 / CECT 7878 / LMG 23124 / VR1) TaxID=1123498 RepID=A0A1R4LNR6_VIBR1|nr:zinc ribbon domain-containing protein [Vibrio ruber]SJN57987.1 hypothetical protein VR7878_02588 [Vibrio ruber DSM 16370]
MSQNQCPTCHGELEWDGQYYCPACVIHYRKVAYCPDCQTELERLQACGAVSYFCPQCNEQKSKRHPELRLEFQPVEEHSG